MAKTLRNPSVGAPIRTFADVPAADTLEAFNALVADINTYLSLFSRGLPPFVSTVAALPIAATEGQRAWALDGRKVGEQTGFGSGVEVYYSAGTWRVLSTDAPVTGSDNLPHNLIIPVIFGVAQVGQMLTSTTGQWTNTALTYTYQWYRDGVVISGAVASSYFPVAADVGHSLTVTVLARNIFGNGPPATSLATALVVGTIPVNTTLPVITGTAQVGQTLSASNGVWTNIPTAFTYQWNRNGVAISLATSSTYIPVASDVGTLLSVTVVASNASGASSPATSVSTAAVMDIIPTNLTIPTIAGTAQVGQTLTATSGTWTSNPVSYTYVWKRAGTPIAGATATTYVPVVADIGNTLTVSVIAINSGGSSTAATSAATSAVIAAGAIPANTAVPVVTGTAQVGQTLTTGNGTWTNSPTSYTYQWNRAGTPIAGATASTYVCVVADLGNTLTASVVASNAFGSSVAATSLATAAVIDIIPTVITAPILSGTPQTGVPFTATAGTWTHNPTSKTWQWKSSGVNVGVSSLTYTPLPSDLGNTLTITETAINTGGTSSPSTSAASAAVIAAPLSRDFFGLEILGPIETNIGGSGHGIIWPTWNPTTWRAIDNFGPVPPGYLYTQGVSEWGAVETADGVYDWSLFDLIWPKLISKGVTSVLMSLQTIPQWAQIGNAYSFTGATVTSASPCVVTAAGNTYANGWKVFFNGGTLPTGLTAGTVYYVVHNGTDGAGKFRLALTSGGADINTTGSAGTSTVTAADTPPKTMSKLGAWVTSYLTRATLDGLSIKFVEGLNESNNGPGFFVGTQAELVSMQQQLYNAAKAYDSTIQVLSPPPNSPSVTGGQAFISAFLAAGGGAYCDIIAFHGYPGDYPTNSQSLHKSNVAAIITLAAGKPVWNTEYSSLLATPPGDEIWLSACSFIDWSLGVQRMFFYAYDAASPHDVLWNNPVASPPSGSLTVAGIAYQTLVTWLVGATVTTPLTLTGVVWEVGITQASGVICRAVWTSDGTTPSYTVPGFATNYLKLDGSTVTGLGGTVNISGLPILFTNATVVNPKLQLVLDMSQAFPMPR
jgi:hypothetical protein